MKEILLDKKIQEKREKITELRIQYKSIKEEIDLHTKELNELKQNRNNIDHIGIGRPCSWDCNGFLYNEKETKGQCGVCFRRTCLRCNMSIENIATHVCKQQDINSWEHIKKTTKACPQCGTFIHRIEGCSQMWCTQCHTAFDYETGRIEKQANRIHNPHYYAWIFSSGHQERIQNCQENILVHIGYVNRIGHNIPNPSDRVRDIIRIIFEHHRLLIEFQNMKIPKVNDYIIRTNESIKNNAKKFIQNEIPETIFSSNNAKFVSKKQTISEYFHIMTTFMSSQIDIFNFYFLNDDNKIQSEKEMFQFIQQIQSSIRLYNDTVNDLNIKYIQYSSHHLLNPISSRILDIAIDN
jgi:hypothetical protein